MSYKRKRVRKPINLDQLQLRLTQAIEEAEKVLLTTSDDNTKLQAIYALNSATKGYIDLIKQTELIKHLANQIVMEYSDGEYCLDVLSNEELNTLEKILSKAYTGDKLSLESAFEVLEFAK